jgi:hypothetical protein
VGDGLELAAPKDAFLLSSTTKVGVTEKYKLESLGDRKTSSVHVFFVGESPEIIEGFYFENEK